MKTLSARSGSSTSLDPRLLEIVGLLTSPGDRLLHCDAGDEHLLADVQAAALPFPDVHFGAVTIGASGLVSLGDSRLEAALRELGRVASGCIVLDTRGAELDEDGRATRGRVWWEERCLRAGLRRHPRLMAFVEYEALEDEQPGGVVVMQPLPPAALRKHPLQSLRAERDLHMDMLREAGRRSDAHLARYEWARRWIRPGDVVVDAACGLGYGTALMWDGTDAARITGLDISDYSIAYARDNFVAGRPGVHFRVADVEAWEEWPDDSIDCIVSFETLEHLVDPDRFIAGVRRVLRPGGRFLCSIPNMWVDETGDDPNPYHLHVFDLERLVETVSKGLLVDDAYAQSAGGHGGRFDPRRLLRPLGWPSRNVPFEASAEWWLLVGVKDPQELCQQAAVGPLVQRWQTAPEFIAALCHTGSDARSTQAVSAERTALIALLRRLAAPGPSFARATIRVGIFGTGAAGMKVWEALAVFDGIDVRWFADNNPARQGRRILWLDVIDPAMIPADGVDVIVIGSMSRAPIEAQLRSQGVPAERIVSADVEQPVDVLRNELARRQALNLRQHLVRSSSSAP